MGEGSEGTHRLLAGIGAGLVCCGLLLLVAAPAAPQTGTATTARVVDLLADFDGSAVAARSLTLGGSSVAGPIVVAGDLAIAGSATVAMTPVGDGSRPEVAMGIGGRTRWAGAPRNAVVEISGGEFRLSDPTGSVIENVAGDDAAGGVAVSAASAPDGATLLAPGRAGRVVDGTVDGLDADLADLAAAVDQLVQCTADQGALTIRRGIGTITPTRDRSASGTTVVALSAADLLTIDEFRFASPPRADSSVIVLVTTNRAELRWKVPPITGLTGRAGRSAPIDVGGSGGDGAETVRLGFVFSGTAAVTLRGASLPGTVIAAGSALTIDGLEVGGTVVADALSLTGGASIGGAPLDATVPACPPPPTPTALPSPTVTPTAPATVTPPPVVSPSPSVSPTVPTATTTPLATATAPATAVPTNKPATSKPAQTRTTPTPQVTVPVPPTPQATALPTPSVSVTPTPTGTRTATPSVTGTASPTPASGRGDLFGVAQPGSEVVLRTGAGGDIVARVTAASSGAWELRQLLAGTYLLVETNQRGDRLRYSVVVEAGRSKTVGAGAGQLPITGSNTGALTRLAITLLVAGALLTALAAYLNRRGSAATVSDG